MKKKYNVGDVVKPKKELRDFLFNAFVEVESISEQIEHLSKDVYHKKLEIWNIIYDNFPELKEFKLSIQKDDVRIILLSKLDERKIRLKEIERKFFERMEK